jgi:hypothetical protein
VEEWYKLTCLFEAFPEGCLKITKIKRRGDDYAKIVDQFSRKALGESLFKEGSIRIQRQSTQGIGFFQGSEMIFDIGKEVMAAVPSLGDKPWTVPTQLSIQLPTHQKVNWIGHDVGETVLINTDDIILKEDVHLKCKEINLRKKLSKYSETRRVDLPIAVRPDENGKYVLVMGLTRYIIAKVLDISEIPCIITEMDYQEFKSLNQNIMSKDSASPEYSQQ